MCHEIKCRWQQYDSSSFPFLFQNTDEICIYVLITHVKPKKKGNSEMKLMNSKTTAAECSCKGSCMESQIKSSKKWIKGGLTFTIHRRAKKWGINLKVKQLLFHFSSRIKAHQGFLITLLKCFLGICNKCTLFPDELKNGIVAYAQKDIFHICLWRGKSTSIRHAHCFGSSDL